MIDFLAGIFVLSLLLFALLLAPGEKHTISRRIGATILSGIFLAIGYLIFLPSLILPLLSFVLGSWSTPAAAVFFLIVFGLPLLSIWKPFSDRGQNIAKISLWSAIAIIIIAVVGAGIYKDSRLQLPDDEVNIFNYRPFREGTRAARLDGPSTLKFTENLPRLDGATALYPVYAAFAQAVYPEDEYYPWAEHIMFDESNPKHVEKYSTPEPTEIIWTATEDYIPVEANTPEPWWSASQTDLQLYPYYIEIASPVQCNMTSEAFQRLINGEADIVFLAGISQEQSEWARLNGLELEFTPIGREAFVFLVNSRNPIADLSQEEVRGIYSGAITNWNQTGNGKVGGRIDAYQRPEGSGSQSALEGIMGAVPIMEPKTTQVYSLMSGLYNAVAGFRNYRNALGYSFRYYIETMIGDADLNMVKLLSIDGVAPARETISDGSYPFASDFYAVTVTNREYETDNEIARAENTKLFIDWILSAQGQELIDKTGYVALAEYYD